MSAALPPDVCVCGLSGSVFMDGADGILSFHHENRPWEIRHTGGGSHARVRRGVPKSRKEMVQSGFGADILRSHHTTYVSCLGDNN